MRLGGEDTAWLHMDDAENPMVVTAMVELAGTLDAARLLSIVEARGLPPRMRSRVVERRHRVGPPRLEIDPSFEIERHLVHVTIEPGEAALRTFVSRQASTRLDPSRPLWRTFVIDRDGAPTAVLFRVHHALGDGFALLGQLLSLCDEHDEGAPAPATRGTSAAGVARQAVSMARLVALPSDPQTTLKHPLGIEKNVAWSRPIPLERIKRVARSVGATINDVLVSAVAGALGRHLRSHGEATREIRAMVPVNLRSAPPVELGNRFGLVILALPVGSAGARERIAEVKRRMDALKATPEAFVARGLLDVMGWLPVPLEALGAAFFAKKASLVLTNVPGPRKRLHHGGVPIDRVVFWVPQAARLGLGVSIFSYAGAVTVGVIADALVVKRPEEVVAALDEELVSLLPLGEPAPEAAASP
jgi:diacylglycerol O-acyltransferase